jgi:hypothetical protein
MMAYPYSRFWKLGVAMALLALASLSVLPGVYAKTRYEAQIGGFVAAVLQSLITGEFAGQRPSQADARPDRPICKANDYADLRAAANDKAAFDAFRRRCDLVETIIDTTHVHSTAYLPHGHCEILRRAFETALVEQVYSVRRNPGDWVIIEYKGSRYAGSDRELGRGARLQSICQDDGSLRVSAPRNRK